MKSNYILAVLLLVSFSVFSQNEITQSNEKPNSLSSYIQTYGTSYPKISNLPEEAFKTNQARQSYTKKLDSLVYRSWDSTSAQMVRVGKKDFKYNSSNKYPTEIIEYSSNLEKLSKNEFTYDANDEIISEAYYYWNDTTSTWVGSNKYDYEFNNNQDLTKREVSQWIGNQWLTTSREIIAYTPANLRDTATYSKLDIVSNSFIGTAQFIFVYDNANNLIVNHERVWNTLNSQWENKNLTQDSYNSSGLRTLTESSTWNTQSNAWEPQSKNIYYFTQSNKDSISLGMSWNDNTLTYDSNGLTITTYSPTGDSTYRLTTWFNNSTLVWDNESEQLRVIDTDSNLLVFKYSVWNHTGNYWDSDLYENDYDLNGNRTLYKQSYWNPQNATWVPSKKTETDYTNLDQVLSNADYYWDTISNLWIGDYKRENIYDNNGNVVIQIISSWSNSSWAFNYKTESVYDPLGIWQSFIQYVWDTQSNSWLVTYSGSVSFDYSFPFTEIQAPRQVSLYNQFQINSYVSQIWIINQNQWQENYSEFYYYSNSSPNSVEKIVVDNITVYPNPFTMQIIFKGLSQTELYTLSIYTTEGKQVLTTQIKSDSPINTGQLSTGLYIYKITNNESVITGKIIKQ